jgi:hypothetical protein
MTSDPLDELGGELRRKLGAEVRAEAEITEWETEQGRRRHRRMEDIARESMHRGDQVAAEAAGFRVAGQVIAAGRDYLTIDDGRQEADVRLAAVTLRRRRMPRGGRSGMPGSLTLRARMTEYELTGELVTVVATALPEAVEGRIEVVAADHVAFTDREGGEWYLPIDSVVAVLRARPGDHRPPHSPGRRGEP